MRHLYPGTPHESARVGLCAHKLAADLIYHGKCDDEMRAKYVNRYTLEGVKVTDEIFDLCVPYVKSVLRIVNATGGEKNIETLVKCVEIHPECFGFVDFWTIRGGRDLWIWDFKTGRRPVEAFENRQLSAYASAILSTTADPIDRVILVITQPLSFDHEPEKVWYTNPDRIEQMAVEMRGAAENAFGPSPTARTGAHCRYCSARLYCEAQARAAYGALEYIGTIMSRDLTPAQAGRELELFEAAKDQFTYRLTALQTEVESLINAGHADVAQWTVERSRGNLSWSIGLDELVAIGEAYDTRVTKTTPITPLQAIEAGIPAEVVETIAERKPGRKKLKHDNLKEARKAFGV
jgi:hypothetical protein